MFEELKAKLSDVIFTEVSDHQSEMIEQIKEKFCEITDRSEKLKLLSEIPKSWSTDKIHSEFGVTKHVAKKLKQVVQKKRIFCNADKKIGRQSIENETIETVIKFYRDNEISKVMPGIRQECDCIVYKDNMEKEKLQRRLVLFNLKEVYELFKEKYPDKKIGFSKFATLRPRECVLAMEKYGTHRTCVCSHHQNCKLIIDSLHCDAKDYREIINMCLCEESIRTTNCNMNECRMCPGSEKVARQIESRLEENFIERLTYKQWFTVGGKTSLEIITKESDEFIQDFCTQIKNLIPHDFIAKQQGLLPLCKFFD